MNATAPIVLVDVDAKIPLPELEAYAHAQSRQLAEHFAPAWFACDSSVSIASAQRPPEPDEIQIRLLNQPTQDGALGYHDETPEGLPIAYVFVGLARDLGAQWTTVASHEVLELRADPYLRRCVMMPDGFWDAEVADRVEQDSYLVDGVPLSNFNTPQCFEPPKFLAGVKFDYMGLSTKPNEVRPGGYAQHFDSKCGWVQIKHGRVSPYRAQLSAMSLGRGARRKAALPAPTWWQRLFSI